MNCIKLNSIYTTVHLHTQTRTNKHNIFVRFISTLFSYLSFSLFYYFQFIIHSCMLSGLVCMPINTCVLCGHLDHSHVHLSEWLVYISHVFEFQHRVTSIFHSAFAFTSLNPFLRNITSLLFRQIS